MFKGRLIEALIIVCIVIIIGTTVISAMTPNDVAVLKDPCTNEEFTITEHQPYNIDEALICESNNVKYYTLKHRGGGATIRIPEAQLVDFPMGARVFYHNGEFHQSMPRLF